MNVCGSSSLPAGDGGDGGGAEEAGLLLRVPRLHRRQGQRGAENLLPLHRHEQAPGPGAELSRAGLG